jgi:hypothetical protein
MWSSMLEVGQAIAVLLCASYTTGSTLDCDGEAAVRVLLFFRFL